MSKVVFFIIQFIFTLWPLFIAAALIYSFSAPVGSGRRSRKRRITGALSSLGARLRRNIFLTWAFLFVDWIATFFAPGTTPSLIPEPWNTGIFLGGFALLLLLTAARLGLLNQRIRARLDFHRAASLQTLKTMDPYGFEALVTETYRAFGYHVQHVGHSGDHGVDIELRTKEGQFWIAQCKRYNASVGESIIRDLYGTMVSEKADKAILVTTAEITPPARTWAHGKPIDLVDGQGLLKLVADARERTEGTFFDRMAHFFGGLLLNFGRPASLREPQPARMLAAAPVAQPVTQALAQPIVEPIAQPIVERPPLQPAPSTASQSQVERTQPVRVRQQPKEIAGATDRFSRLTQGAASVQSVLSEHQQRYAPRLGAADPIRSQSAPVSVELARDGYAQNNGGQPAEPTAVTQPRHHAYAPLCPACHMPMVIRAPRPGDSPTRVYFRCANYPACRVVVELELAAPKS